MKLKKAITLLVAVVVVSLGHVRAVENIDPDNDGSQYAWGENIGWLNFEPCFGPGVTVSPEAVVGYVWAENIGWINLSPTIYGGISNDGTGNLSGYAWAENAGWINFDPNVPDDPIRYGVTIDNEGEFGGWAWGENIGWINFSIPDAVKTGGCLPEPDVSDNWSRKTISDAADSWIYPRIAVHESYVHVVWHDIAPSKLVYRRSTDGGKTWDTQQILENDTIHDACIAVSGQYVHVVWRGSGSTIKYCRSTDNGASFGSVVTLSTAQTNGYHPDVTADGNYVYVVWVKSDPAYDILFTKSTDNGDNWESPSNVTTDGATIEEKTPRVAANGTRVYVVWVRTTATNVYALYKISSDAGSNWSANFTLWDEALGTFDHVAVVAEGSNVFADRDNAVEGPLQRVSTNGASTFGNSVALGTGNGGGPEVDASSAYTAHGYSVYIRDNALFVSNTSCGGEQIDSGLAEAMVRADIGVNDDGDVHVVCSSDYNIYYYREKVVGDVDGDGDVDIDDFGEFSEHWRDTGCGTCGGADLTGDGNVYLEDLGFLVGNWLAGVSQ